MSFGQLELQQAIFTALNNDSTLTDTLGATIVDDVPHGTSYPFVKIGEARSSDYSTKDFVGGESLVELHIWSQYKGSKECKQIMDRLHSLLHNSSLSVSGFNLINMRFDFSDILQDSDGSTRHGVMRFRAIILGTT
tara:strand:- start:14198 stop:14605 length:408 start_codon:yes stop_codon:yes gene_type:complete